jgi:hypothetical protein
MKYGVKLKIDVSKIDKNKLFKGQKGVYLDATVFLDVDTKDQYDNNGMITQDIGKDAKGPILGNAQVFWNDGQQGASSGQSAPQQRQQPKPMVEPDFDMDSDIPF